jgi:hypothetical protein
MERDAARIIPAFFQSKHFAEAPSQGLAVQRKVSGRGQVHTAHNAIPRECLRRVSTTLRQVLTEFSEFFHESGTGLLIQTSLGRAGGLGALRTKRSG